MGNSAIGRGTAVEENKVKASSGDATPGFLDAKVDGSTVEVVANQLISSGFTQFYSSTSSRDLSLASGTQVISGVGFTPKLIFFNNGIPTSKTNGWGTVVNIGGSPSSISTYDTSYPSADTLNRSAGSFGTYYTAAGSWQDCTLTSLDADGFTLTWGKNGSPTGTLNIIFTCVA